jgi:hypothetical protein
VAIAGSSGGAFNRQAAAQRLLKLQAPRFMTWPAQEVLRMNAAGSHDLSQAQAQLGAATLASGGSAPPASSLTNVRVNNPAEDSNQVDQTTQSETAVAVSGSHVAVGFNDSQRSLLALTAATNLTGYAYSTDGGASFTDGGVLPNATGFINLGDPWLASDRGGNMFFGTLAIGGLNGNLDVAVAKSTDGGKTWGAPVPLVRPGPQVLYIGDKDAVTTGRDPDVASRDVVYAAWDDFTISPTAFSFGLAVAHSTDGGATWQVTHADTFTPGNGCTFTQYIGAQPIVDPASGTLFVAAEKIHVDDPNCVGLAPTFSEAIFKSTDGGKTFGPGVKIADVTPSFPNGLLELGPGQYMRNLEFPTLAFFGGALYASWNDGASGHSHIRLAKSTNGGASWSISPVTSGSDDELQPALSADTALHVIYYRRNPNRTLDVFDSDSTNGSTFTVSRVTTQSSPGVFTVPQFDPVIAFGYMGDYIANASDGTHQYFAWGDNRDTVTNWLWPNGRHDPNVYFAKR